MNLHDILLAQCREREALAGARYIERRSVYEPPADGRIRVVVGPRRAGKSRYALHRATLEPGGWGYVNFDDERLAGLKDFEDLVVALDAVYGNPAGFLFDEIQNTPSWELFVNRLHRGGRKLLLTGSNAHLLGSELATHLTGRHVQIPLLPFSFSEYLEAAHGNSSQTDPERREACRRYARQGGFPEVVLNALPGTEYLRTLLSSVIYRDIVSRFRPRDPAAIETVARCLLSQPGGEYSFHALTKATGCRSPHTLKKIIGWLEGAFVIFTVPKFSFKVREQAAFNKKAYAVDAGFIDAFGAPLSPNWGCLMENLVAIELFRRQLRGEIRLFYWRDAHGIEADFVVQDGHAVREIIQVCLDASAPKTRQREVRGLCKASRELKCQNLLLLTENEEGSSEETLEGKNYPVRLMPVWKWLLAADVRASDQSGPELRADERGHAAERVNHPRVCRGAFAGVSWGFATAMPLPYTFDDPARKIVITEPRLPQPWINYLSNGDLHAFVSQAGGGCCWWKSPLKNRITRYRQYNLPIDSPGFYVYLREADGSVWCPTWRPVQAPLDAWRAEHSPGLTRFVATRGDLTATLELFIPPGENALVWDVSIANASQAAAHLDVFGYVEFGLLDWKQDTDWACYVKHNLQVEWDEAAQALVYVYRHFHFNPHLADCPLVHFAASAPVASWSADRDAFVGPYRDERDPVAVERNACDGQPNYCGDPAAALQVPLDVAAGANARFQFFLSTEEHAVVQWPRALESARATLERLRAPGAVDRLRSDLDAWWAEHLGILTADLPDPDIARQITLWGPVQSLHTARYSRSFSQHAAGVRTLGFRDTCQDMLALAYRKPAQAAATFRYLISQQYEDGHAPHQCNPVEKAPAEPRIHIDNPLWLVLLAHALLAETGDFSLLDERLPWLSEKDNLSPVGSATVWEHLLRIPEFIQSNLGSHGLPLIHKGDWNDSIGKFGKQGRGESVFAAQQYVYILRQLAEIARARGDAHTAARLDDLRGKQTTAILTHCWDGAWWRRAFDDDGHPVGTAAAEFGQIWLNSQSWSVLSGVGSDEQNRRAMDSVAEILDTNFCGIKKLHPSYKSFPEVHEPYSGYSPGCGENGAIFCHANTWAIIAEALLGRPERAWHYYRQLVPHLALQTVGLDRYKAEPYAYVSNIIGPENPKYGWANVTQVTGTAAWMDLAATQYLLGIRPEIGGLRIAPCLPPDWPGFTATRTFRGCEVRIEVRRGSASELTLDGTSLHDTLVPTELLTGRTAVQVVRTID